MSDRSSLSRHGRTAVTSAAFALVACAVLTACDGSSGASTPSGGASSSGSSITSNGSSPAGVTTGAAPSSGTSAASGGKATRSVASQTPSAKPSPGRTTKSSYRGSSSTPAPAATGTWGDTYHPLPAAATVPSKAKLKFVSIDYSALDGGWNLTAMVTYPGAQRSPLLYFALQSGSKPAGPAAPFQLKAKQTVHVFITGDRKPTPTDVVVYASTSGNAQGRKLLSVAIPAKAIPS